MGPASKFTILRAQKQQQAEIQASGAFLLIYDLTNSGTFSVKGTQQNFSLLQTTCFQNAFQRGAHLRNVLAPELLKEGKKYFA